MKMEITLSKDLKDPYDDEDDFVMDVSFCLDGLEIFSELFAGDEDEYNLIIKFAKEHNCLSFK